MFIARYGINVIHAIKSINIIEVCGSMDGKHGKLSSLSFPRLNIIYGFDHFRLIIQQIFLLAHDWSKHIT